MRKILAALALILFPALAWAQAVAPPGTAALVCAYNTSPPALTSGLFAYVQCDSAGKLITSGGGGAGTVTSIGETFTGGLISVAGSPITTSGTFALTVAGTSGGVPYFSGAMTWASSAALAANALVIGGGAGAAPTTASGLTATNTSLTLTHDAIAATPTIGLQLTNTTAATIGVQQQISPSLTLSGSAWKTLGATSVTSNWRIYSAPDNGTPTAQGWLLFDNDAAAGSYSSMVAFSNSSWAIGVGTGITSGANGYQVFSSGGISGGSGNLTSGLQGNLAFLNSTGIYQWYNSANANSGAADTGLSRTTAGIVAVGTGAQGSVAGLIKAAAYIAASTSPTVTTGSCSGSSAAGGATAGTFVAASCTAGTYILSGLPAAPTGYSCQAQDRTTLADSVVQSASSTTSATFTATTAASDVVQFQCMAY